MANFTKIKIKFTLAFSLGLIGCGVNPASELAATEVRVIDVSQSITRYQSVVSKDTFKTSVKKLSSQSFGQFYSSLLQQADNVSLQIDSFNYDKMKDRLNDLRSQYQQLGRSYQSIGHYWHEIGFDPNQPITASELREGLKVLQRFQKVDLKQLSAWSMKNSAMADELSSKKSQVLAAKVLVLMMGASLADNRQQGLALDADGQINHSASAVNPFFPPAGQGPVMSGGSHNNTFCTGDFVYGQNGNRVSIGPVTTGISANIRGQTNPATVSDPANNRCFQSAPTPVGSSSFNNNVAGAESGAIVTNGNNVKVGP